MKKSELKEIIKEMLRESETYKVVDGKGKEYSSDHASKGTAQDSIDFLLDDDPSLKRKSLRIVKENGIGSYGFAPIEEAANPSNEWQEMSTQLFEFEKKLTTFKSYAKQQGESKIASNLAKADKLLSDVRYDLKALRSGQ